jgi:hypothetical protein
MIPLQSHDRLLVRLIYLQAIFLALAYAVGVWQTLIVHIASITTPSVILHVSVAVSFGVVTGLVGLLAGFQGMRKVMVYNLVLFFVAVIGGASGLAFLGNSTSVLGADITNLIMITVVGIGIPISGFSLAKASRNTLNTSENEDRPSLIITYLAFGALAIHMVAGVGVISTSQYNTLLMVHLSFAALTGALTFGVLILVIQKCCNQTFNLSTARRMIYSFVGLAFVAIAAGAGAITLLTGTLSFEVGMAEFAILAYIFLLLSTELQATIQPSTTNVPAGPSKTEIQPPTTNIPANTIQPPTTNIPANTNKTRKRAADPLRFTAFFLLTFLVVVAVAIWFLDFISQQRVFGFLMSA